MCFFTGAKCHKHKKQNYHIQKISKTTLVYSGAPSGSRIIQNPEFELMVFILKDFLDLQSKIQPGNEKNISPFRNEWCCCGGLGCVRRWCKLVLMGSEDAMMWHRES